MSQVLKLLVVSQDQSIVEKILSKAKEYDSTFAQLEVLHATTIKKAELILNNNALFASLVEVNEACSVENFEYIFKKMSAKNIPCICLASLVYKEQLMLIGEEVSFMKLPFNPTTEIQKLHVLFNVMQQKEQYEQIALDYQKSVHMSFKSIMFLDEKGEICFVNSFAQRLFKADVYDLIQSNFAQLVTLDQSSEAERIESQAFLDEYFNSNSLVTDYSKQGQFKELDIVDFEGKTIRCEIVLIDVHQKFQSAEHISSDSQLMFCGSSGAKYMVFLKEFHERETDFEQAQKQTYFDGLTGLYNKESLTVLLKKKIDFYQQRTDIGLKGVCVIAVDIVDFSHVNMMLNYAFGDKLLTAVAQRIKSNIRFHDVLCRSTADKFYILCEQPLYKSDIQIICKKIDDAMAELFDIQGHELYVSIALGALFYNDAGFVDPKELLLIADHAVVESKRNVKSTPKKLNESYHIEVYGDETDEINIQNLLMNGNDIKLQTASFDSHDTQTVFVDAVWNTKDKEDDNFLNEYELSVFEWPWSHQNLERLYALYEKFLNLVERDVINLESRSIVVDQQFFIACPILFFNNINYMQAILNRLDQWNLNIDVHLEFVGAEGLSRQHAIAYLQEIKQQGILIALRNFGESELLLEYLDRDLFDCAHYTHGSRFLMMTHPKILFDSIKGILKDMNKPLFVDEGFQAVIDLMD